VAAQRGGRRRAAKQDGFRDALVAALAEHLDVEQDRLSVTVTLDGEPVPSGRLPASISLAAPTAATRDASEEDVDTASDERPRGSDRAASGADAPTRNGRSSARRDEDRGPVAGSDSDARGNGSSSGATERDNAPVTPEQLDEEAEAAADLLEGLLDAMDLPGDLRISVQDAHAEVEVVGLEEGVLIGRRGQTLDAVQELVRTAMQRRFERRSRVLVDVDGYRARRLEKLLERADEAVQEVLASGESQRLEPMDSIERRLVHQRVAETPGVVSNSHGREPSRRIVIELAD